MKKCCHCKLVKPLSEFTRHDQATDGKSPRCVECQRKYQKLYRINNLTPEQRKKMNAYSKKYASNNRQGRYEISLSWRQKNKQKVKAYSIVAQAIKSKEITKGQCVKCGDIQKVEAHHNDYSKPLEVIWLCPTHHKELHRTIRSELVLKKYEISKQEGPLYFI